MQQNKISYIHSLELQESERVVPSSMHDYHLETCNSTPMEPPSKMCISWSPGQDITEKNLESLQIKGFRKTRGTHLYYLMEKKNPYKISPGHYLLENGQALEEFNIVEMVCYNPRFYFRPYNCQLWTKFVSCKYPSKKRNVILLYEGKKLFFYIYMYSSQLIGKTIP